jgi:tetratricopeptide (TPR) repeat protein
MIQKLLGLLHRATHSLESADNSPASPDTVPEEPNEAKEQPAAEKDQAAPAALARAAGALPLTLWQRIINAERERLRWLRSHPPVIGIVIVLAIVVVVAERWLIQAWGWLISQMRLLLPTLTSHPVALIGVGIALFYLLFGLRWLRRIDDFVRWVLGGIKRRPRLSAFVGGILLLIGLWLANNHSTWVVLPFTVGQTKTVSLSGEKAAIQLIAELNQIGVGNPTPVLILWEPQEPRTSTGSVTARRNLPLEECDEILKGPGDFIPLQRIPLPRVLTGSQGSRLDLGNLSIGTISIPSQIFTQFVLKLLPTGYREFNGQINESGGELEISISSRNPPNAWRVAGPSDTLAEMMEYLALRMALDLNPELIQASGLDTSPSDRDLAFAMGNHAFRQGRYQRAWAFFELADQFEPLDEKVDAMLGLTYYHLALEQPGDDPSRFDAASQAMKAAVHEDPNGDSSLLRPYLACLYHKVGLEEETKAERTIFTRYLLRLEFQARDARTDALKQLPLRGPGRHLSVAGSQMAFVDNSGAIIVGATSQPSPDGSLQLDNILSLPDQNPRQIGLYGDSILLFISSDGAVLTYDHQMAEGTEAPNISVEGRALSGVQRIGISASQFNRTNLFLLNRFGKIYWCEPDAETGSTSACPPQEPILSEPSNARQIFPTKDQIYILAADGAVWRTEINVSGQASPPRQLTSTAPVQEIYVASDGTLYLLHDNGNVWRYYDDGRPETEDLKLIDGGTGTDQIFAAGGYLYLLKSDGAIWRISNPRNPAPTVDLGKIWTPPEGVTIQEMFVTAELEGEDAPDSRNVYLLTDQRVLLQGTDTGDPRLTLAAINVPTPTQTAASQ